MGVAAPTKETHVHRHRHPSRRRPTALAALVLAASLVVAACGGGSDDADGGEDTGGSSTPVRGGSVVYGIEAENSGGWCLPEAQLAISGIQVARAIYDTLTVPDEQANYQPYLAKSVTPNDDYTQWTITLREGITFHDGSELDATVVKNNIDAWRGAYPARSPLLFTFVYEPITDVQVVDPLTVQVTTATPWPAFPAYLFNDGRSGIMAQAQLDDPDTCDRNLIGTGPFKLKEWKVNDHLTAVRNPDYWQTDADGNQLPYLDSIEFRPIVDASARVNALLAEELDVIHESSAEEIDRLRIEEEQDKVALTASSDYTEVTYELFNVSKPPFDNLDARLAVVHSINREQLNAVRNLDLFEVASGPFAPGEIGYLEDTGFPSYDLEKAKDHLAKYEQTTGEPLEFTLVGTPDPGTVKLLQFLQEQMKNAGITANIRTVEQAALINTALGDDWDMIDWRNHPGGNPDGQYIWWKSGSPVNFGKFSDPEMDRLLDAGRAEPDKDEAASIYEDINKRFASQAYNLWLHWVEWNIATQPDVHGVYGPDLPDGGAPFKGLATGHPVHGLWIAQ
jgi:peptide/nickel transport system substrate-binding protein